MESRPDCGSCGAPLSPATLDTVEGRDGSTRVRLSGLPILACPERHERREPRPDFGVDLVEALFARGALPVVVETGFLWFRTLRCAACDRDLGGVDPEPSPVRAEIAPEGVAEPFEVIVETETLTCPDCGLVQLRGGRERGAVVLEATADALAGAEIRRY